MRMDFEKESNESKASPSAKVANEKNANFRKQCVWTLNINTPESKYMQRYLKKSTLRGSIGFS